MIIPLKCYLKTHKLFILFYENFLWVDINLRLVTKWHLPIQQFTSVVMVSGGFMVNEICYDFDRIRSAVTKQVERSGGELVKAGANS